MNKFNRYSPIFFDIDDPGTGGGAAIIETITAPGLDVPVLEPAGGGHEIQEVTVPETSIKGPEELFGEKPEEQMAEADAKMGKATLERGPDGKFLPKKKDGAEKPVVEVVKAKAKPLEVAAPVDPPAKLKLGEEEKTAEEWLAEMKQLREQVAKVPDKVDPKPEEAAAKAQEEQKHTAERRKSFLDQTTANYTLKNDRLDTILGGGPEAVKAFAEELAKVEVNTREAMAKLVNECLTERDALIQPLLDQHKSVSQFTEENQALSSNAQLKAHPQGLETYRKVKAEYQQTFDSIQQRVAKGEAVSPAEQSWAILYGAQKPEDLRNTLIERAAAEAAKIPIKTNGNGAPTKVEPKAPLRITRPLNTDRPGGPSPGVKTETQDARLARELGFSG